MKGQLSPGAKKDLCIQISSVPDTRNTRCFWTDRGLMIGQAENSLAQPTNKVTGEL